MFSVPQAWCRHGGLFGCYLLHFCHSFVTRVGAFFTEKGGVVIPMRGDTRRQFPFELIPERKFYDEISRSVFRLLEVKEVGDFFLPAPPHPYAGFPFFSS